jgi:DNA-binding MarR family transcriptional regulator
MTTKPLPKWIMYRYAKLWNSFNSEEFTFEQAYKILKIDKKVLSVLLSDLKKNGWIVVSLSQEDSRKRLYKLKPPEIAVQSMEKP